MNDVIGTGRTSTAAANPRTVGSRSGGPWLRALLVSGSVLILLAGGFCVVGILGYSDQYPEIRGYLVYLAGAASIACLCATAAVVLLLFSVSGTGRRMPPASVRAWVMRSAVLLGVSAAIVVLTACVVMFGPAGSPLLMPGLLVVAAVCTSAAMVLLRWRESVGTA